MPSFGGLTVVALRPKVTYIKYATKVNKERIIGRAAKNLSLEPHVVEIELVLKRIISGI